MCRHVIAASVSSSSSSVLGVTERPRSHRVRPVNRLRASRCFRSQSCARYLRRLLPPPTTCARRSPRHLVQRRASCIARSLRPTWPNLCSSPARRAAARLQNGALRLLRATATSALQHLMQRCWMFRVQLHESRVAARPVTKSTCPLPPLFSRRCRHMRTRLRCLSRSTSPLAAAKIVLPTQVYVVSSFLYDRTSTITICTIIRTHCSLYKRKSVHIGGASLGLGGLKAPPPI